MKVDAKTRVVVLTGAGISKESGISTFQDLGGRWEGHSLKELTSLEGFARDPDLSWRYYNQRKEAARAAKPNPAHEALARMEEVLGERFLLVTQNVDGLHRKAGSHRILELHGNLFSSKCSSCDLRGNGSGDCDFCGARLRPGVVWFGEQLRQSDITHATSFMAKAEKLVFITIGTSGTVYPAASLVDIACQCGAVCLKVNLGRDGYDDRYDWVSEGSAVEAVPGLIEELLR